MAEINRELLKELGLTTNEVEVYLKLLGSGSITVNELATKTGLYRQACYDALDRLLEKGFVNFVVKDSKKHFQALNPEKLVEYVDYMKQRLEEALPELERIAEPTEKAFVEVHKGKNAIRGLFRDMINTLKTSGTEVLVSGVEEDKYLEYDKTAIEKYINDIRKFGFKEKLLAREGAKTFFPGPQSEYRLLPTEFFNPTPTHIYGDKVVFILWGDPVHTVLINNREIADANRKQFYLLWGMAKKLDKKLKP